MNKYRVSNGLAVMPDSDMKMLHKMSLKGWHVTGMSGIHYRFEQGEPHSYIYNLNMEKEADEEMLALYKASGWEPLIIGTGLQIFRAEEGTTPIFSDAQSKIEVLEDRRKFYGKATIIIAILLIAAFLATLFFEGATWLEITLLIALFLCWMVFVSAVLPFIGLCLSIRKLKRSST